WVIPGSPKARSGIHEHKPLEYRFRARGRAAPRNDGGLVFRSQKDHRRPTRNFRNLKAFLATVNEAERTRCPGLDHRGRALARIAGPIRGRSRNGRRIIAIMPTSSGSWPRAKIASGGGRSWRNWRGGTRNLPPAPGRSHNGRALTAKVGAPPPYPAIAAPAERCSLRPAETVAPAMGK